MTFPVRGDIRCIGRGQMDNRIDMKSLVRKYVENKASNEEIELLQEYFKTPAGLQCLDEIINEYAADFDKAHLTQSSHIDDEDQFTDVKRRGSVFSQHNDLSSGRKWFAAAAAFIGMAMLAGVYFYISKESSATVYKTIAGQKSTFILPDNTIVTLNGNSTLSYRGNWKNENTRSVILTGEAYFNVTSNAQKPFIVNASGISIKVLGTIFNVKSYDEDDAVETTLVEGKVLIEQNVGETISSESIELLPDHKAIFSKNSKQIALMKAQPEREAAWVRGSLVFEDEPFYEVVKDLERYYGARITVTDQASLQCRFNARIENESLEEVLKLFSLNSNMKYSIDDDKHVRIEGSLCSRN